MSLSETSKNLNINSTVEVLEQLNGILDTSQAAVSFWGTRQISYKGERVSFTELAQKVSRAAHFCRENGLDELRREQWISISQKIAAFYDKTDTAVKNRNFITRFFVSVREFHISPYTQRFFYEEGMVESNEVLEQLNGILDTSQAAVSFWGTRQISCKGERVSFTELAQKVSRAAHFCGENGLDELRREQWISIFQKIAAFYDKTDTAVKNRNFITRFFVSVREFHIFPYTQRFFYEEGMVESNFRSYSKEAVEKLKEAIGTVDTSGSSGPPPREHVTEEAIRRKAQMDRLALTKI